MSTHRPARPIRRFAALALVPLALACGTDAAAPVPAVSSVRAVFVRHADAPLWVGGTLPLTVEVQADQGTSIDQRVIWSSTNAAVASVDANGLVSGRHEGTATITAASVNRPSVTGSATFTVTLAPVTRIVAYTGDRQTGVEGTTLPTAVSFKVTDTLGQARAGLLVTFLAEDGRLANATAITDAAGVASAGAWTLGAGAGPQFMRASVNAGVAALVGATALPGDTTVYAPRAYRVFDITNDAGQNTTASRLNNAGQVVGNITGPVASQRGFLWDAGAVTWLDPCRFAADLNDAGQVVCWLESGVALWDHGAAHEIAALAGQRATAEHINRAGVIAGTAGGLPQCSYTCPFYTAGGVLHLFAAALAGSLLSVGEINSRGNIIVSANSGLYSSTVRLYSPSGAVLRTIDVGMGAVHALNDRDWMAGNVWGHPDSPIATVWRDSEVVELGVGVAVDINNAGVVVGQLERPYQYRTRFNPSLVGPFVWDGRVTKLLARAAIDPAWTITSVVEINDGGDILAIADNTALGRLAHYVLLRPAAPRASMVWRRQ